MSKVLKLQEKGFGSCKFGMATVIAGIDGKPVKMRLLTLPNSAIGGEIILIDAFRIDGTVKSFMYQKVYSISVTRHGSQMGTIKIIKYKVGEDPIQSECGFTLHNGEVRIFSSEGMLDTDNAKDLVNNELFNAFERCLQRTWDPCPDKMYFGVLATDGQHQILPSKKFTEVTK